MVQCSSVLSMPRSYDSLLTVCTSNYGRSIWYAKSIANKYVLSPEGRMNWWMITLVTSEIRSMTNRNLNASKWVFFPFRIWIVVFLFIFSTTNALKATCKWTETLNFYTSNYAHPNQLQDSCDSKTWKHYVLKFIG